MYKIAYPALISLTLSVATKDSLAMPVKGVFDNFCSSEMISYFNENFDEDSGPTLHKMMYAGQRTNDWTQAAKEVGILLAKFRQCAGKDQVKDANFNAPSPLHDWLQSLRSSPDNYVNVLPDRLRAPYSNSTDHMQQRASEALKLLEQQSDVCLQNVVTKNVKYLNSKIQVNGNNINARFGPDSLDAAIFLADILLMYYKQMGVLEHGVQYKTVDMAQEFGRSFDDEVGRQGLGEDDRKRLWGDISLLTGWEIVRRYVTKDDVAEILARPDHDPASVVESGLRLINNENVKNPNFLVAIALALLH